MNYLANTALGLFATGTLYYIYRKLERDKVLQPKVNNVVTQIRNLVPVLSLGGKSEVPESYDNPKIIQVTLPTVNNQVLSLSIKIENIKTLFICKLRYETLIDNGYCPWSFKVISPDSMDEQTSNVVNLALDRLNQELRVKAKESINAGYRKKGYDGYYFDYGCYWKNNTVWNSFDKATYGNYGAYHMAGEHRFNEVMQQQGNLGNLI